MSEPIEVRKHAAHLYLSEEQLSDAAALRAGLDWALNATPEQWEAREAELRAARAAERAAAERVPLDLAGVLDKLGWSDRYAEHLVQPYCTCYDSHDGWDFCQHAYDEGVVGDG